jgi:hypothetical protein
MKPKKKPTKSASKPKRGYSKHGLTPALKAIKRKGLSAIDQRSRLAKATSKLRSELVSDLGGQENLSSQQTKLIDEFIVRHLMVESIDCWLFQQPSLIDRRHRALWPMVLQRMTIADGLVRVLKELGLERKAKAIPDLQSYLNNQSGSQQP